MYLPTYWSELVNTGQKPNAQQHALYIIISGLHCNHPQTLEYLKRAFNPVVNKNKKNNGRKEYDTLLLALTNLRSGDLPLPVGEFTEPQARIEIERLYHEVRKEVYGY